MKTNTSETPWIRVIPLGGLGEIGKNMMILETVEDIVVIDAGVQFPELDMPGVDVVIPDMDYVEENIERVRGLLITHGHEDHIGAVPHFLKRIPVPVYAPAMAEALLREKLRQAGILDIAELDAVEVGEQYTMGGLTVEWFSVCHSIPDSTGIAIQTPAGIVIHTGDFKIDNTPAIGYPSDLGILSEICQDGALLVMSDSTYAEYEGYSTSDREVVHNLPNLIGAADGRVIVSSFASQIARIQIVANACITHDRKLCVVGRSMVNNTKIGQELGHLNLPEGLIITPAEANSLPDKKVVILTTGSQGESQSGLVRMSNNNHRDITIQSGDTIIISASTIPGNEVHVNDSINELVRLGATVITNSSQRTHVPGHARKEELRMLINATRPEYFVPIHGEYRMLKAHADLAMEAGIKNENVFLLTDGDVLELDHYSGEIIDRIEAGHIFVDGLGMWDESGNVILERRSLSHNGVVTVAFSRDSITGALVGKPKIVSAGFVHIQDADNLLKEASDTLTPVLAQHLTKPIEWMELERVVRNTLTSFLRHRTKRRPLIIISAIDV
ncbi:MAG: ribonuclease J [SAR202 cluster bacterium]|nr:ribonuclease J [SAR202 cluster bacterium]|tara:strand:+ start:12744 stop:14417 length:1674 start_codon:yes stop_codon:yes gene_type:complete